MTHVRSAFPLEPLPAMAPTESERFDCRSAASDDHPPTLSHDVPDSTPPADHVAIDYDVRPTPGRASTYEISRRGEPICAVTMRNGTATFDFFNRPSSSGCAGHVLLSDLPLPGILDSAQLAITLCTVGATAGFVYRVVVVSNRTARTAMVLFDKAGDGGHAMRRAFDEMRLTAEDGMPRLATVALQLTQLAES